MVLDVVSWNVNGFAERQQPELLAELDWEVCAIQEATTPERLERFAGRAGATSWCSAREHLEGAHADRRPAYVAAVLAKGRARFTGSRVVDGVPSPERALVARVETDGRELVVGSMALPPASSRDWGAERKVEQCRLIVGFLRSLDGPVVVGLDANTPRRDAIDLAETDFWNDGEEELLGAEADHGLRDVYRELVELDPARVAELRRERPDGPLAVSYVRRSRVRRFESRYDFILASRDLAVVAAAYDYDRARAAGSDHAVVSARLALDA